ncbi:MAG: glutaredoxin [Chloroflexi bacterium]|nr:glutaredoxin [Chloroflexota bacterium]
MSLLDKDTAEQVRQELANLTSPVRLVVFTQEFECAYCAENRQLAEELSELSDQISIEVYDFVADKDRAAEMGIDKIPAIAVVGTTDYGIRFYGIPAGYEFTSLLHTIKMVAAGLPTLSEETLQYLQSLDRPVELQVFVTPTCPYCPQAVVLAHQMALASPRVSAAMVEATEFPHLAQKYEVMGVPRTVINGTQYLEGAAPEDMVLAKIREALSDSTD